MNPFGSFCGVTTIDKKIGRKLRRRARHIRLVPTTYTVESVNIDSRVDVDYVDTWALYAKQIGATGADGHSSARVLGLFYSLDGQTKKKESPFIGCVWK